MRQEILFLLIAMGLVFTIGGCSKKLTPVTGSAGLSEERVESAFGEEQPMRAEVSSPMERPFQKEEPMGALEDLEQEEAKHVITDIFFEFNQASLKDESKLILQKNAEILMVNPGTSIQVQGHTDERGSEEYNLVLGARRARITKRFLEALGVDSSLIQVISFGEERPFCAQSEERCWRQNRRAHFLIQAQR